MVLAFWASSSNCGLYCGSTMTLPFANKTVTSPRMLYSPSSPKRLLVAAIAALLAATFCCSAVSSACCSCLLLLNLLLGLLELLRLCLELLLSWSYACPCAFLSSEPLNLTLSATKCCCALLDPFTSTGRPRTRAVRPICLSGLTRPVGIWKATHSQIPLIPGGQNDPCGHA